MRDFDCLQASCYCMANIDEIVTKLLNKDEIVMCLGPEPRYTRLCATQVYTLMCCVHYIMIIACNRYVLYVCTLFSHGVA